MYVEGHAPPDGQGEDVMLASCDGLIGLPEHELVRCFGEPTARRTTGGDTWLVFGSADLALRVRCTGLDPSRVVSWTATFESGHRLLSDAARAVGLWPAAQPEEYAATVTVPLIRRPIPCADSGSVHSLTATVRGGRITQVSMFDEPPDWL